MTTSYRWVAFFLACLLVDLANAEFDPYELNGGLVSAVAGKDFCIIAADTRMSGMGGPYNLNSRNYLSCRIWGVDDNAIIPKVEDSLRNNPNRAEVETTLASYSTSTPPTFIASAGCSADCQELQRVIRADLRAATYMGNTQASTSQVATLLSQMLYLRRGFPYYSFCVVSGMDEQEGPQAFVYDAIGSYEQVAVASSGTGREALQPILDRTFSTKEGRQVTGTADQAVQTLYHAYRSVSEREIAVGDKLVLCVTEKVDGEIKCRVVVLPLKEH
jgi:20S proteasome subunit beta 6